MQKFTADFNTFTAVEVQAPDISELQKEFEKISQQLVTAEKPDAAIAAIEEAFRFEDQVYTGFDIIYIRHSIDTLDPKYKALNDLVDQIGPRFNGFDTAFGNAVLDSKFLPEIEKHFGSLWLAQLRQAKKTFRPEIIPLLQKENELVSEYGSLTGGAQLEFRGKVYSISGMGKFTKDRDRATRKSASALVWKWYADNDAKIGAIYSDMIKVRTEIAHKLGYDNFIGLAYDRMGRLDWGPTDIHAYREQVRKYIVPLAQKLREAQKKRLGFGSDTQYYDYGIFYKEGDPVPRGNPAELMDKAQVMYDTMDKRTAGRYFATMRSKGMFDLEAKPGKQGGGYESYIPGLKLPFIFSNFNGTSDDVDVLTHEFGHALQACLGADQEVPNYRTPTSECAEMHSMSMEFLTYPYMDLFFGTDADRYRYMHLAEAITFIPYGTIVDAFQEYVYANPDLTHEERKAYWRKLELDYLPYRQSFEGNAFLASGGFFERQGHIFEVPFYYVDYTISQVVSLEFFVWSLKDHAAAYDKYLAFSSLGGTLPFKALLKKAQIPNPMVPPTMAETAAAIESYLEKSNPGK